MDLNAKKKGPKLCQHPTTHICSCTKIVSHSVVVISGHALGPTQTCVGAGFNSPCALAVFFYLISPIGDLLAKQIKSLVDTVMQ